LESLFLYLSDDIDYSDSFKIEKRILEQFPEKREVIHITDDQSDKESRFHKEIATNFCIPNAGDRNNRWI